MASLDERLDGLRREHSKGSPSCLNRLFPDQFNCNCGADAANAKIESLRADLGPVMAVVEAAKHHEKACAAADKEPGNFAADYMAKATHKQLRREVSAYLAAKPEKEKTLMNFGQAIDAMKQGCMVQRAGWNGKGMHLYLEEHLSIVVKGGVFKGDVRRYEPCIVMFTAQGKHQPGWLASQADMLADDWSIVVANG